MSNKFTIIPVTTGDIPRLSIFLANNESAGVRNENEWTNILEWMWLKNPSVKAGTELGWALEDADGSINGFIGNVPVQYKTQGEMQPGIWGTSWYVSEQAKELSLKMYIRFTKQREIILSNTQTPRVEIVMKKLGFAELPVQWFKGAYVFPLSIFSTAFLQNSIKDLSIKKMGLGFFGMLTKIPQAFIFLFFNRKNFAKDITLEKIDSFPRETNSWFEEFSNDRDCTFIRDKKNYEWLFCDPVSGHRFLKYKILYQKKMQGFLIFKTRTMKGFRYLEIIDEALLPLPHKIQKQLLLKTIFTLSREAGTNHFLILHSNMQKSAGFFQLLGGVKYNRGEKGYIKSSLVKPGIDRSTITSIDGDNLFF